MSDGSPAIESTTASPASGPATSATATARLSATTGDGATRKAYPGRPAAFAVERISGSGDAWTAELVLRFEGEDPHFVAAVLTLRDGRVVREAIYIAEPWDPPEYRSRWVSG